MAPRRWDLDDGNGSQGAVFAGHTCHWFYFVPSVFWPTVTWRPILYAPTTVDWDTSSCLACYFVLKSRSHGPKFPHLGLFCLSFCHSSNQERRVSYRKPFIPISISQYRVEQRLLSYSISSVPDHKQWVSSSFLTWNKSRVAPFCIFGKKTQRVAGYTGIFKKCLKSNLLYWENSSSFHS